MLVGLAVFCVSAAVIGYEILLMRLLTITQWHHFAYMIISIALLGFGASGTFVALAQTFLLKRFHRAFSANGALFGVSVTAGFAAVQTIPLNPLEILWDTNQWVYLLETYLVLFLPFFFAANCISLTLARFKDDIHRIYLFDLLGAGFGALGIILLLFVFQPVTCLEILSAPGFLAAGLMNMAAGSVLSRRVGVALLLGGLLMPWAWPDSRLTPSVSEFKGLSMALRVPDARIIEERSSPLGWLAVVESPTVPFRHAPGMSLNCTDEPPPQLAVFVDGDALSTITKFDGERGPLHYLDCMTSALPYHLLKRPRALVLGAGGGSDVLTALYGGAGSIDAVELDPKMVDLVRQEFRDFAGDLYGRDEVRLEIAEARGFVAGTSNRYDLIQVSLLDSFNASAAGGYALSETYLYTVEGIEEYLRHLDPGGFLCVTRWLKVPPRDGLKLFATAVAALERQNVDDPGKRLAMIRGWKTTTLLVKNGEFSAADLESLRAFCEERSFDVCYYPGITKNEANRYNVLDEPYFFDGAFALLGRERRNFMESYKFAIGPATDDRPYFFHFFKWKVLPEILSMRGQGGLPLIEWTYPILILTLLQAVAVSTVLILLPLVFGARMRASGRRCVRTAVYFFSLGLAFLFIEIAFIQKFILFLSHPLYAVSVVLAGFLIFAGLGSSVSGKWKANLVSERAGGRGDGILVGGAGAAIAVISFAYMVLLPPIFHRLMALPDGFKVAFSIVLIAPLAFCMGMPFPLGLSKVAHTMPAFIPWAWGINGCASVLSAVLATILAIHLGFNAVIGLAVLLYGLAAAVYGWQGGR
jgi:SAM-dependent methyltransferase